MIFTPYGKEVEFSDKEMNFFKKYDFIPDNNGLEVMLSAYGIDSFSDNSDIRSRHNDCINAIKDYLSLIIETVDYIEREHINE